jgi:hypothetical protein
MIRMDRRHCAMALPHRSPDEWHQFDEVRRRSRGSGLARRLAGPALTLELDRLANRIEAALELAEERLISKRAFAARAGVLRRRARRAARGDHAFARTSPDAPGATAGLA